MLELVMTLSMMRTLCTEASACSFAICDCSCSTRAVCSARSSCSFFFAAAFLFLVCWCALADIGPKGCLPALPGLLEAALLFASCSSYKTSSASFYGFDHSFIKRMFSSRVRYVEPSVACMRSIWAVSSPDHCVLNSRMATIKQVLYIVRKLQVSACWQCGNGERLIRPNQDCTAFFAI